MSLLATQNILCATQPSKAKQPTVIKHDLHVISNEAIEAGKNKQINAQKIVSETLDKVCNCLNSQITLSAKVETVHSFTEQAHAIAQKKSEQTFKKTTQELERLKQETKQLRDQLNALHQKALNSIQAIITEHEKNIVEIQKKHKDVSSKLQQSTNSYAQAQTEAAKKELSTKINVAKDEKKALLESKKKTKTKAKIA